MPTTTASIAPELLALLRCPVTLSPLKQEGDELVSPEGTRYPIHEGIPILLADKATLPPGIASVAELKAKAMPAVKG